MPPRKPTGPKLSSQTSLYPRTHSSLVFPVSISGNSILLTAQPQTFEDTLAPCLHSTSPFLHDAPLGPLFCLTPGSHVPCAPLSSRACVSAVVPQLVTPAPALAPLPCLLTAARVILQGCWVNHVTPLPQLSIFLWSPSHSEEEPRSPEVRNPIQEVLTARPLSLTRSSRAAPASWLLLRPSGCMPTPGARPLWLHTHSGCTPTLAAHPLWMHAHSRLPAPQNLRAA